VPKFMMSKNDLNPDNQLPTSSVEQCAWENVYKIYQNCRPGKILYPLAIELSKSANLTEDRRMVEKLRESRHKFPGEHYEVLMQVQKFNSDKILENLELLKKAVEENDNKKRERYYSRIRLYSIRAIVAVEQFKDRFNLKLVNGKLEIGHYGLSRNMTPTSDGSEFDMK
jgi:hypothetical protein